ncbi:MULTISPECIES: hypothetical protein [unclassified Streptomyces]|uniref:hypothetical protein n=1 Tax=unclassified Streptomyces TaxID=2593676 RepID=UPI0036A29E15
MTPSLLVPFSEHPADRPDAWAALLAAAPALYGVVLNPAGGPGTAPDPAFAEVADGAFLDQVATARAALPHLPEPAR